MKLALVALTALALALSPIAAQADNSAVSATTSAEMQKVLAQIDALYTSGQIDHAEMLALRATLIAGAALAAAGQK